ICDGVRLQTVRGHARSRPCRRARAGSLSRRRRMTALLSIEKVGVCYGKAEAVRDVSLDVARGQIVTVLGANAAGKTRLLMTAIGLLPCSGRVKFDVFYDDTVTTES